jgi:dTDP-N-acetylfucosamine:lipid II N-acetylfucosaminyltransferase
MNYHLMVDEKFIDDFIIEAEAISPSNNTYIFTFEKANHVDSKLGVYAPYGSEELALLKNQITKTDKVFVHQLNFKAAIFVCGLSDQIEVNAFFWGGDFLSDPIHLNKKRLFGPKTLNLFNTYLQHPFLYSKTPREFLGNLKNRVLSYPKEQRSIFETKKRAIQKINYIFHWNEFDQKEVNRIYQATTKFIYFFYEFGLHSFTLEQKSKNQKEVTILLGNSDSITNNHIEAIDRIADLNTTRVKVYCPLNYGINPRYVQKIEAYGKKKLGTQFHPIKEFMQRDKYYEMVADVDFAIMNHYRTQGAANVFFLINAGIPVFMHHKSSLYQLLRDLKIEVYQEKDIPFFKEKIETHKISVDKNRQLLSAFLDGNRKTKNLEKVLS